MSGTKQKATEQCSVLGWVLNADTDRRLWCCLCESRQKMACNPSPTCQHHDQSFLTTLPFHAASKHDQGLENRGKSACTPFPTPHHNDHWSIVSYCMAGTGHGHNRVILRRPGLFTYPYVSLETSDLIWRNWSFYLSAGINWTDRFESLMYYWHIRYKT